jgi:prepilin-type N-terminal cleavage/methylation domain-containing protein
LVCTGGTIRGNSPALGCERATTKRLLASKLRSRKMNAMADPRSKHREGGFTLLELLIVVAITVVVAAIAIPNIINGIAQYRLRGAASDLSGLIQKGRMLAVSQNRQYALRQTTDSSGFSYAWVDLNNDGSKNANEDVNSLYLPRGVVFDSSSGAPSYSSMSLGFTPASPPRLPVFTARGLPCVVSGGACTATGQGYIQYLRQDRTIGATAWAAVTVTPAGRVRVWTWNGSAWQ